MERVMKLLDKELCRQFREKLLYEITSEECRVYAAASFGDEFMNLPEGMIAAAIEKASNDSLIKSEKKCRR